ncbi:hypothetical protein IU468_26625 [Nocardia farcinica]|uniref:hypothetical protein n=1 Tax=Nocardia farcinica TaxID=37329 RepID=UPI00189393E0|nr:hypothetical protein [Nocardia farcinica]MBF6259857.1 hypothetical protein [Nocardia farcinica]
MNEKFPNPQHNSGQEHPGEQADPSPPIEADSDREWQVRWDIGETLLRAVYDTVEHPGEEARVAAARLALGLVQLTHEFDLTSEADKQALAALANTVADRIAELADAYDDLTTSDLQGGVQALAFMLVRNMLPVGGMKQAEGGDHE